MHIIKFAFWRIHRIESYFYLERHKNTSSYYNDIIKKSFITIYPTSIWIHHISRTRPKNKWVWKNAKKMTFARNEKWHHGCSEFNEAAKIMPIIKIEHRKLIKMQFVNPMKMMVMANSKTIFYFALIVCVRKSIDTIVQKNTAA